ncbi:hypothetical protein FB45DRAFT_1062713 [Roridomyces roridus]|uniref:Uncharacterized protein n=1 Tax=Roridomyces roridus TaxID=1738132 RepID=A0AAD7FEE1_9AGAR|nr:hypothetical protein FB45DRAFT_1062713 [Roridomyces roridus]
MSILPPALATMLSLTNLSGSVNPPLHEELHLSGSQRRRQRSWLQPSSTRPLTAPALLRIPFDSLIHQSSSPALWAHRGHSHPAPSKLRCPFVSGLPRCAPLPNKGLLLTSGRGSGP